jgi:DNA-binding transcriptional LysR family regulator
VFQAVVETGGFTSAANSLGVSQPFVSQTIQRLETRVGAKLLHRTTRGHRLTSEGECYLEGAKRVMLALEAAEADWQQSDERVEGQLRVSVPIAFGLDRITPLIPQFLQRYPNISMDLRLTDEVENLIDERIDVAIRMGTLPDSSFKHRRLCRLQRILVAAPTLLEQYETPKTPEDLASLPCVAWDGGREHLNRWHFMIGGESVVFHAKSRFRSNQGMSLYQMCLAGIGMMRVAEHLARPSIEKGQLIQLLGEFTPVDDSAIYAVFLQERQMVPRIRSFIDFMVDAFRSPEWE